VPSTGVAMCPFVAGYCGVMSLEGPPVEAYWLTVVSVHKDDHQNLKKTLKSMSGQLTQGVEFIVVDGSSNRIATIDLCTEYVELGVKVLADDPRGIYAAMNIGLARAQGRYISFLNAGDCFHSDKVLCSLRVIASKQDPVWIYGDVQLIDRHGRKRLSGKFNYSVEQTRNFRAGRFPMQPASLVQTDVLRDLGGFDLAMEIAADYKMTLELSKLAPPTYWNGTVVDFALGGTSSTKWINAYREAHRARMEVFSLSRVAQLADVFFSTSVYLRGLVSRILGRV